MSEEGGGLDDQVHDETEQHEEERHQEAIEPNITGAHLISEEVVKKIFGLVVSLFILVNNYLITEVFNNET